MVGRRALLLGVIGLTFSIAASNADPALQSGATAVPSGTVFVIASYEFLTREDLLEASEIVAVVRVTEQHDIAGADVWRVASVETLRLFKGNDRLTRQLFQPGGSADGREQVEIGMRYLKQGSSYLVFMSTGMVDGAPQLQLMGHPELTVFTEVEPGVFENLGGTYRFSQVELDTAFSP